jgi:RNA polymerase sigma-70 factor (ECF subfamily)
MAIDALRSAHARRMDYVGMWLPEPIVGDAFERYVDDPAARAEVTDELALAAVVLLERLTPAQRAVFVLRESLGLSFAEIAEVVGQGEANCRQLDRRARQRLAAAPPRRPTAAADHGPLLERFVEAVRGGDVDTLLQVLAPDCVSAADGGGMPGVSRNPIDGADRVARYFLGLGRKAPPETTWQIASVNGRPGLLTFVGGVLHNVIAIDADAGRIRQLFITVNRAKLPRR